MCDIEEYELHRLTKESFSIFHLIPSTWKYQIQFLVLVLPVFFKSSYKVCGPLEYEIISKNKVHKKADNNLLLSIDSAHDVSGDDI